MKKLITIVFMAIAINALGQQAKKRLYRLTRTLVADLNNDKRPDTIRLFSTLDDWNSFDKIFISLTGYGKTTFEARDYWTLVDSDFLVKNKNAIHTKLLFLKSTPVHSVILLFGEMTAAGYRDEFSMINVENNKVKMVFDAFGESDPDIEVPVELSDLEHNDRLCLAYTTLHEFDGFSNEKNKKDGIPDIGTYTPYLVYPVDDSCKMNKPLSKAYMEKHYVFAGYDYSEKINVLYPRNGGQPTLWKKKVYR